MAEQSIKANTKVILHEHSQSGAEEDGILRQVGWSADGTQAVVQRDSEEAAWVSYQWTEWPSALGVAGKMVHCPEEDSPKTYEVKATWDEEGALHLWVNGENYRLTRQQASGGRRRSGADASASGGGSIKAPMPGKVLNIPVEVGDSVDVNATVVIMESMKMEMTLTTPIPGTVTAIEAEPLAMVDMGTVLVVIEPHGE